MDKTIEDYNQQIKAAMSFWRVMPDGEAKNLARQQIAVMVHKRNELVKKERVHAEALVWNEAYKFFR